MKTVLVTGATGCVGHHVVEALLEAGAWRIEALVRDPARFRWAVPEDRVTFVTGDVADLAGSAAAFAHVDAIVHLATAWGDPVAYPVNVDATLALARLGKPMVYFSTASILDETNRPLPEAVTLGTDYIRSKYLAYSGLRALPAHDHVMTLFPTLIVAGEGRHPASHLGRALPDVGRWLWIARRFTLDGTFHLIHARDLARMVLALLERPRPAADLVAGNAAQTVEAVLGELCGLHGLPRGKPATEGRRGTSIDLTPLAPLVASLVGDRMTSWDRFCLAQRHFRYATTNPRALGLAPGLETLTDMFAYEGWGARLQGAAGG